MPIKTDYYLHFSLDKIFYCVMFHKVLSHLKYLIPIELSNGLKGGGE